MWERLNTPITWRTGKDWKAWLLIVGMFVLFFVVQTLIVAAYVTYFEKLID
jgi:hypothetical protein